MNYQWNPTAGIPNTTNTGVTWFSTIDPPEPKWKPRPTSKSRRLARRERAALNRIWAKARREGVVG